ncbi:MAG: Gfo/Idh/MocA family oxidoreductase [Sphingobacteriaceae bacterium]|nr:Gfo/Idh/MocA family oxidoreductase [Sphingobacteriaceae bacterium]
MKFLQIGCGSMGKRRIRNLQFLNHNNILCYDKRKDRLEEVKKLYNVNTIDNIENVNWDEITHVIISTPPDVHHPYVILAASKNKHVFIEASVVDEGYNEIREAIGEKKIVVAPSCTMRFDPLIVKAKEILDAQAIGNTLFVNHYFGQYLPDWHKYESIKDFYVSKRQTGAAREIVPFDMVYINWLFGNPSKTASLLKNTKTLGIDIDDIYSLLYVTDKDIQISFTIDVVSRASYRETKVIASNGNLEIDNVKGTLKVYTAENDIWKNYTRAELSTTTSNEEMYVKEMDCFVKSTNGETSFPFTMEEDHKVLSALYKAEKSFLKIE